MDIKIGLPTRDELIENYCKSLEAIGKADVVVADVPCSGLGIIGNKSDIKHNVSKKQIFQLVEVQRKILEQACKYVKIGGRLVYSTCTVQIRK